MHLHGTLIKNLAWIVAAGNGAKDPAVCDFVNPYGQILEQEKAKLLIDRRAALTFLALAKENKLPSWVISYTNMKLIRSAAN